MWMAAALFSSLVKYTTDGGTTWVNVVCGNVTYSHSISGVGSSGIATRQISFQTPAPFGFPKGQLDLNSQQMRAWIEVAGLSGIKFFVDTRSVSKNVETVSCVDSTALLDTVIDTAEWEASPPATGERHVTPDEINAELLKATKMTAALPLMPTQEGVPLNLIKGKTFQQLLNDLSSVAFGFYKASTSGFEFISCKLPTGGASAVTSDYALIDDGSEFSYNGVLVEADEEYTFPEGISINTYTLTVGGTFANYADSSCFSEISGITYQEWRCSNALFSVIPEIGTIVGFNNGSTTILKRVTSVSVRWVGQTMVVTLAGTIPENGELNRQSRYLSDVEEKVEQSKTYGGNMMITPYQGIVYLEEDAQEEGGQS